MAWSRVADGDRMGQLWTWFVPPTNNTSNFATHSMRRTKATLIYRRTGNLRVVQLLLGHTRIESTRTPPRRIRKSVEVGRLATSSSAKWQAGQVIKSRNVVQAHVPIRPTRDKDVSVGACCEGAVETPGGYYEKCPIHLKAGKCRTTFRTEAFLVPGSGDTKSLDSAFA
jgi:hypothetical protein